jgi:hypothetical protein
VACGAVLPRPEQDAAFTAAAEQRIRAATETIDAMKRKRGFGRFFST